MSDKELYVQKAQAKLDEWNAEIDKLKARMSGISADAQLNLNQQIKNLEGKIEKGRTNMAQLVEAGEDAWESLKDGFEAAWETAKATVKKNIEKPKK